MVRDGRARNAGATERRRRRRDTATVCRRCRIRVRWHQIRFPYCGTLPRAFWIAVAAFAVVTTIVVAIDLLVG
jgi:hypothetical protein